jgi:hypothetical protein
MLDNGDERSSPHRGMSRSTRKVDGGVPCRAEPPDWRLERSTGTGPRGRGRGLGCASVDVHHGDPGPLEAVRRDADRAAGAVPLVAPTSASSGGADGRGTDPSSASDPA